MQRSAAPLVAAVILAQLLVPHLGHLPPADLSKRHYRSPGEADFTVGVLMPVHTYPCLNGRCENELNGFSLLQRLEAVPYVVEEINRNQALLGGYTLGYVIYDDSYRDTSGLGQALRFVQRQDVCYDNNADDRNGTSTTGCPVEVRGPEMHPVVGVISSENSPTTRQVASLLTSFRVPQVSYMATSTQLSARFRFPYFLRTVPPDTRQSEAIVALMRYFSWKYASVVYSEGDYGSEGYKDLLRAAHVQGICFGLTREIDDSWGVRQYKDLIYELLLERDATAVVAYTTLAHARNLLAFSEGMAIEGRITWITTDAWMGELSDLPPPSLRNVVGAISVKMAAVNPPRFYERFQELTPATSRNPWMGEYLREYFNCTYPPDLDSSLRPCSPNLNISRDMSSPREKTVSLVYDTVYAFAHALEAALRLEECSKAPSRADKIRCGSKHLMRTLRQVRFQGETDQVYFDEQTSSTPRSYVFYNVQNKTGQWSLVPVGDYRPAERKLTVQEEKIQWSRGTKPNSNCNAKCAPGYAQKVTQRWCCMICEKCPDHHIVRVSLDGLLECRACRAGFWPDEKTRHECLPIEPTYVQWHEPLGVIVCSLASTGLAACLVVTALYIMNNSHRLVRASSRELSYFLLGSIFICYGFCFCFIIRPRAWVCVARQVGICLCFTLLYGPVVTKTTRIYRIFEAGTKMSRKPRCVGSKSQLAIALTLVVIHGIIILGFVLALPPDVEVRVEVGVNRVDLTCTADRRPYITSFTYNGLLLLASMYCAFKTRKLPDHFNESKFISFCVYSTLVIWLAIIPAYFAVTSTFPQTLLMSVAVLVNATLVLICIFLPKLVAVYIVDKTVSNEQLMIRRRHSHRPRDPGHTRPHNHHQQNHHGNSHGDKNLLDPNQGQTDGDPGYGVQQPPKEAEKLETIRDESLSGGPGEDTPKGDPTTAPQVNQKTQEALEVINKAEPSEATTTVQGKNLEDGQELNQSKSSGVVLTVSTLNQGVERPTDTSTVTNSSGDQGNQPQEQASRGTKVSPRSTVLSDYHT